MVEQVTRDAKYAGYLAREDVDVARQRRLADERIPDGFDFAGIRQLRDEAREKLARVRPTSLAQAGRISGITPADLAVLMVHLEDAARLQPSYRTSRHRPGQLEAGLQTRSEHRGVLRQVADPELPELSMRPLVSLVASGDSAVRSESFTDRSQTDVVHLICRELGSQLGIRGQQITCDFHKSL